MRKAAEFQPKEAEPHFAAGMLLEQEDKFADAEQEYKRALELDPGSGDAVTGLANIYMRGRRFPEAEEYLRKLLAAHRGFGGGAHSAGASAGGGGQERRCDCGLAGGNEAGSGRMKRRERDLAELYTTAGKNDLAEAEYRGLMAAHPNDAELHRRLGQALLRQKKFPEAQQEFVTGGEAQA